MRTLAATVGLLLAAVAGAGCDAPSVGEVTAEPEDDVLLECFDADYPIEPTFDDPVDALANGIEGEVALVRVPVPDDPQAYERVERDDGWLEFTYRESDDHYFVWGITRDEDGRWGMTSLGGCYPADL